jgi:DinB superfamily
MPLLHEPEVRSAVERRLNALRPDSRQSWGKMTASQMLWHVNQALEQALGHLEAPQDRVPLPRPMMKFIVLNLPWPKNAPTNPSFVAKTSHDFEAERARCRALIVELVTRRLEGSGDHPMFGRMSGRDTSRLQAKHLDHHLRQFGV